MKTSITTPPQSTDRFTFDLQRFADLSSLTNDGNTYYISSVADLNTLAAYVNTGNDCEGLIFKQTKDITFDTVAEGESNFTAIGNNSNRFNGTFDGDGYTISDLTINSSSDYQGLFGYVGSEGEIHNVNLVDAKVIGNNNVGALVGCNNGGTVENCISTNGTVGGDGANAGGIVGYNYNSGTVSHSLVDGGAVYTNSAGGGVVGYNNSTVENCLVDSVTIHSFAYSGFLVGYPDDGSSISGYYYNMTNGYSGWGVYEAYLLTLSEGITVEFKDGDAITFGDKTYYAEGAIVTITITTPDDNKYLKGVTPNNDGTYTVTSSIEWADIPTIEGLTFDTTLKAYKISSVADLEALAAYVNEGGDTTGLTFKQTADIIFDEAAEGESNFTAIGNNSNRFNGTFDGDGYTISDLTINSSSDYQGLFGYVGSEGEIHNVNLVDAKVIGNSNVGGLVGYNAGTVENCTTAGGTVNGTTYYVGGLVGYNYYGTVSDIWVHDVTVSGYDDFGSFVGNNNGGTISGYYYNATAGFTGAGRHTDVYLLTLPEGITAEFKDGDTVIFRDNTYYKKNATITTLTITDQDEDKYLKGVLFNNDGTYRVISSIEWADIPTIEGLTFDQSINAYKISSVEDLQALAAYVNEGGDTTDLIFKQTADITFTAAEEGESNFTAIGWYDYDSYIKHYFNGTFDGGGYTISNLTINNSSSRDQGLFGDVDYGGMILNVNLVDANVNGRSYVGALVGYNGGTIVNCTATGGTITGTSDCVGGLVGYNYNGTVENSLVDGGSVSGEDDVGGLVGYNAGTVENSLVDGGSVSGDEYIGGLVGYNYNGTVENCTTTGDSVTGVQVVGGLVGYNDGGTVENSLVDGGSVSGDYYAGGLVGYNAGTVENSLVDGGSVSGDEYIGGLVGYNEYGTVESCLLDGGSVSGDYDVGSFVGNNVGTLQNFYFHNFTAEITGEGSDTAEEVFRIKLPENVMAQGDGVVSLVGRYYTPKDTEITLAGKQIQDNATYAVVDDDKVYTITKDKTIDVDVYISVNGGTFENTTENISVIGGDGDEILINTAADVTLNGGAGNDSLVGSDNTEVFVYGGGVDSIKSFTSSDDKIRLADGFEVSGDPQVDDDNFTINFADGGKLIIEGAANLNSIDLYNEDGSDYQTITIEDIVFNNTNKPLATSATVKSAYGDFSKYGNVYSITASKQNSQLVANAKNNTIVISGGNENILTGGLGNDTFNFGTGGGIVTDYGIGATKNGDGTAATANGTDIVKVDGKVTGIYFERDGNTKKDPTFTATIVYDNDEIIVLKDIVKKPTKTGSSPIYQTNDVAAATLKIWDTSGSKQAVLSATKLKNLFHDDNELTDTQQEQVNHLSELVQPKTDVTATSNGLQSSNPFATQLTFTGNKSKN